ncbi:hypothetical protein [Clostridium tetani]|uniref:DUF3795 domain-containing protein n=1 Tax=Clostridium tetani TaxID=1513 RepID=A0ABY0ER05_CLOTA|nr:hypothetical protein [Clostridium tetani]CDI49982.1 hypothetical protein BN906_01991 [Clostridium tetani 12124569]KHO38659.1 hypothetical protein OR62_09650 [Clostridium tetani]RXI40051.1 hypothetical protein DP129_04840 [Clostridium tetani]RXI54880.1 hypothetical protein DP131_09075 [Clostridium tetani]RXI71798.1 hypothetical protein DQN76_05020 [Clostridium tetani]
MSTNIDYNSLISTIGRCCLTEEVCGSCSHEKCLIGYCNKNLLTCIKSDDEFVDGEIDNLPILDTKIFDKDLVTDAIGFTLNECKNCNAYHDEDCIINLVRSACEIILIGDNLDYNGSTLLYLNHIKSIDEGLSKKIHNSYLKYKEI